MRYPDILHAVAKGEAERVRRDVVRLKDDPHFVRWVRFHQMGSLFYDLFPETREIFLLDRATSLSRWRVWSGLREILKEAPVPVMAFKGVAVGELYPDRLQRLISDVDLWVEEGKLEKLTAYLIDRGLERVMDVPGQRIFRYMGLPVEVHTAFTRFPYPSGIGEGDVLDHMVREEGNLFFPDEDLSLSLLYVHAYKSMYVKTTFKAIWWYDERLLTGRGAKVLNSRLVEACRRWFLSVKPADLRDRYLEDSLLNRLRYVWHGVRLRLP